MARTKKPVGLLLLATAVVSLGGLTACQTTGTTGARQDRNAQIDAVLERAADQAEESGKAGESLALLERMYRRKGNDAAVALKYGRALREAGELQRAAVVMEPLARNEKDQNAEAKIEYASIQMALGNYMTAEDFARQAVLLTPEAGQAYHLLGIALDAQGHHEQAETAFRKGLDNWSGDPGPILNNLGLNLASQGFLDEAIDVLRKAQASSPDRMEIERNLRIVKALQVQPPQDGWIIVPKPGHKPDFTGNEED